MKRRSAARTIARVIPFHTGAGQLSSLVFIVLSMTLMGVSAIRPQVFDGVRGGAADAMAPVLRVVSQPFQKVSAFFTDVTGLADLQTTNMRLEQENARLREWYQTAMLLDAENKSLRDLLNVKIEPQNTFVTARVIADAGNAYVKSLLVTAGKQDGVDKAQSVLAGQGLIGRIVEAGDETARVLLITDMNSRVPVVVEDTLQHAIMAGENTDQPRLIHLPQDSDIAVGARLVTSGHGGIYPQGLPVGRVIEDEKGGKRVELFADLRRLQHVRIVKKPDDPNLHSRALLKSGDL